MHVVLDVQNKMQQKKNEKKNTIFVHIFKNFSVESLTACLLETKKKNWPFFFFFVARSFATHTMQLKMMMTLRRNQIHFFKIDINQKANRKITIFECFHLQVKIKWRKKKKDSFFCCLRLF